MRLKDEINELKKVKVEDPKKIFTMYLNTDRSSPDQQKGEWKIHLKNGLKGLADATKESDSHEEKNQSKTIRVKVEKEVYEKERELLRGLVLIATADEEVWFEKTLQIPVKTEFHWEDHPVLDQLEMLERDYPYTGIVVIQKDEAAILETEMGMLVDQSHYTLDMNTDDWRQHQGPQGDDLTVGGAKRDEYNERVKANQQRWFKSLVSTVEKKAGQNNWEQLYLVGEKDEVEPLKEYFNTTIDKTIPRNLLNRDADKILAEILG